MATNSRPMTMTLMRNRSIDDFNEQVVNMLDEVEKRGAASMLEQKRTNFGLLNSVSVTTVLLDCQVTVKTLLQSLIVSPPGQKLL
ncbi:hypothetical protein OSTOST_21977, partial [Ostertagia ostertagi]